MRIEAQKTFFALALAIPIVSTTAGLRGVLEAYQKFDTVNIMRVFLGIFTFLGPIVVLFVTNSLFWIVIFLIVIRIVIWALYLFQCFKTETDIKRTIKFDLKAFKPVLRFSIWITIANFIGPIMLYSDRFLIGSIQSAKAITYYATPYEMVTKLLIIPSSLVGVLFPVFSSSFYFNPELSKKIFFRGVKFVFLIIYPAIFLIITFAFEGMNIWLGQKFAMNSSFILQLLAVGIIMNCLSLIPNNYFQGIGKPKIPTLINLAELPVYLFLMWFMIGHYGIKGAAIAYMIAATYDAFIMYFIANKKFKLKFPSKLSFMIFQLMIISLIIPFFLPNLLLRILFASVIILSYFVLSLKYFYTIEERIFFISKLKMKIK